jgi:hypothetical protein
MHLKMIWAIRMDDLHFVGELSPQILYRQCIRSDNEWLVWYGLLRHFGLGFASLLSIGRRRLQRTRGKG